MINLIVLSKKNPKMSKEQFQEYYENKHSKLVHYIKELVVGYERNYPRAGEYDCITKMTFADQAAFDKVSGLLEDPKIRTEVETDEEVLFDRSSMQFFLCDRFASDLTK